MIVNSLDTSFIYRVYDKTPKSIKATKYLETISAPLPISSFLQYEFMQSVRLQMFRRNHERDEGFTREEGAWLLETFTSDLSGKVFAPIHVDISEILKSSEILSVRHTREHGYRSIDILHVATALHLSAQNFLTFDKNQSELARAEGLQTPMQ